MFSEITEFAKEISIEAGKILMDGFRSESTEISYKSRTDLVTNIDKASEEFLYSRINEKFTDHSIIAEEGSRKEATGNYLWYVDPLDGTNNYAHGIPVFCISIGVYSRDQKKITSGIVYNPYSKELFSAEFQKGAYLNNEKIAVSKTKDLGISLIATGFPYDKDNMEKNNLNQFNKILPGIQGIRRMGSAATDLCYLACGRIDGYWEPELKSWDMAAGSLIVEEAGGTVTQYNGSKFNPEFPEILASNGYIHNDLINALKSA